MRFLDVLVSSPCPGAGECIGEGSVRERVWRGGRCCKGYRGSNREREGGGCLKIRVSRQRRSARWNPWGHAALREQPDLSDHSALIDLSLLLDVIPNEKEENVHSCENQWFERAEVYDMLGAPPMSTPFESLSSLDTLVGRWCTWARVAFARVIGSHHLLGIVCLLFCFPSVSRWY